MLEKKESKLKVIAFVLALGLFFYWRSSLPSKDKKEIQIVFPEKIYIETTDNQEVKDFLAKTPTLKESVDKSLEYFGNNKLNEAVVILERVVSENKGFRDGQYLLAQTYIKLGENQTEKLSTTKKINEEKFEIQFDYFDKAEIALRKALVIDPIDNKSYQLLGDVMEKKGNIKQAEEYRKKAEELK